METNDQQMTALEQLFYDACSQLDRAVSLHEAEPFMALLLCEIQSHEALRPRVVEMFKRSLTTQQCPWEVIQFCLHGLRWPEMLDWIGTQGSVATDVDEAAFWHKLLDAFNDNWEDADSYNTFKKP